jgi:hypothetical protein
MSTTIQIAQLLALTIMTLAAGTVVSAQDSVQTTVKITDSKLSSINMGLDSAQHWLEKMQTGDTKRGATLTADLEKLATRFNRIPKSEDEQYKFIVNRFATLAKAIQNKSQTPQPDGITSSNKQTTNRPTTGKPNPKLFTVNKQLNKIEDSLRKATLAPNEQESKRLNQMLEYAQEMFESIPMSRQPDYATTKKRLESISQQLKPSSQQTSNQDPIQFLAEMRKKYTQTLQLPRAQRMMSKRELTNEDVTNFLGSIQRFQADIETDLPNIRNAATSTRSSSDVLSWVEKESVIHIKNETEKLTSKLDRYVDTAMKDMENLAGLDPEKNKYSFVTESVRKNNEEKFARAIRTLEEAKSLEAAFKLPSRWSSKKEQLEKHFAIYLEKAGQAATVSKLPKDIGDKKLSKIAKETLAVKKYGAGKSERLIVNSKMVPRDRIQTRFFNGNLETEVRKWDEFQACTVEKEDGKMMVYFNTFKKFSRAPSTTPIDQWILSHRYKSGEIAPENLK